MDSVTSLLARVEQLTARLLGEGRAGSGRIVEELVATVPALERSALVDVAAAVRKLGEAVWSDATGWAGAIAHTVEALETARWELSTLAPRTAGDAPQAAGELPSPDGAAALVLALADAGSEAIERLEARLVALGVRATGPLRWLIRGGALPARRRAIHALGALVAAHGPGVPERLRAELEVELEAAASEGLGYEAALALAWFPGATGKRARQGRGRIEGLRSRVAQAVHAHWADGGAEPLAKLPAADRALLFEALRDFGPEVAGHVDRLLRKLAVEPGSASQLAALATEVAASGDARLTPALLFVLEVVDARQCPEAQQAAAWALGRIGDRRAAHPVLKLHAQAETPRAQVALAAAAARLGRPEPALGLLARPDLEMADIEALGAVARPDVVAVLEPYLAGQGERREAALAAIGEAGDEGALRLLDRLPVEASVEKARGRILARSWLRRAALAPGATELPTPGPVVVVRRLRDWLVGGLLYVTGLVCLLVARRAAAAGLFERAAARVPAWIRAHRRGVSVAARSGDYARAVRLYERARTSGLSGEDEDEPERMVRCYLALADRLVADGDPERARALLEPLSELELAAQRPDLAQALVVQRERLAA